MIRVLLVDDHAVMRAGFRMILHTAGDIEVVGEAATGREAVAAARTLTPDVICIEATRRIVSDAGMAASVVIVTTFDRDDYLFQALAAGASGFLLKNAGPEELIAAVRVAAAGDALLAPAVTKRVIERFASAPEARPSAPQAIPDAPPLDLTERENDVLHLLAQARSNAEIARELFIGEATVKTHVSNVLQKLGARDRVAAVVYAHQHGLA